MNKDRFKFRVWNKNTHSFTTGGAIKFGGLCFVDEEDFGIKLGEHQECYIIEQCTGLKDKNGNLIYEGDILQNPNKDQYIVEWIVDGYWHIRQIDDEKFGCALASIKTLYDGWEIIGNIHEQAEQKDNK